MNRKFILAFSIIIAVSGVVFGVSLILQPGQSILGIFVILAAALGGGAAIISGFNDAYDLVDKIMLSVKQRSFTFSKGIVEDVLLQLNNSGDKGLESDLFFYYLKRTYNMSQEEQNKIYKELSQKGYIRLRSGYVRITESGKKFIR